MRQIVIFVLFSLTVELPLHADIGEITELRGNGAVIRDDTVPAFLEQDIQQMDDVRTANGRLGITFIDDSQVRLTEHSKLVIDEVIFDPDPDKSKIVKKENTITYSPSSRMFVSMSFIDEGSKETEKFYGAYPITDSVHIFGGLDKTTSTGITNAETTGIAYESCCWALRLAHFKEDKSSGGYNYSTGMELVLTGLGSTSSPLKDKIENKIPGYSAKLR